MALAQNTNYVFITDAEYQALEQLTGYYNLFSEFSIDTVNATFNNVPGVYHYAPQAAVDAILADDDDFFESGIDFDFGVYFSAIGIVEQGFNNN